MGLVIVIADRRVRDYSLVVCSGMYYTHPPALKLTKAFKDVATVCE